MEELISTLKLHISQAFDGQETILASSKDLARFYQKSPVEKQNLKATATTSPTTKPIKKPPPPQKTEQHPVKETKKRLSAPITQAPSEDLMKLYQQIAPKVILHKAPPTDAEAKLVKNSWKELKKLAQVPILVDRSMDPFTQFLTNLSKAIDTRLFSSRCFDMSEMEKGNNWDVLLSDKAIKFVIIPRSVLIKGPNLLEHYTQVEAKDSHHIGSIQAIVIDDIQSIMKDPDLKKSLWEQVKQLATTAT